MRTFPLLAVLLSFPLASLAEPNLVEEEVELTAVLASPYDLKLTASPARGSPKEAILIKVTFSNTGVGPLWIPRAREVALGYQKEGEFSEVLPPSACDGLRFIRVSPGETVGYELPFEIPATEPGPIQVYATGHRTIFATVEVLPDRVGVR